MLLCNVSGFCDDTAQHVDKTLEVSAWTDVESARNQLFKPGQHSIAKNEFDPGTEKAKSEAWEMQAVDTTWPGLPSTCSLTTVSGWPR